MPVQKCHQVPKQHCTKVPVKVPRVVYQSVHQRVCGGHGGYGGHGGHGGYGYHWLIITIS